MKPWFVWRNGGATVTCWLTVTGTFGSMDGDGAAAQRYTEARMSKIALEMLRDLNKNTVDFQDNYDGSEREPIVLPSRIPNLLVNGATGDCRWYGDSTSHHTIWLETIDAVKLMMDNPEVTTRELDGSSSWSRLSNWWFGHGEIWYSPCI